VGRPPLILLVDDEEDLRILFRRVRKERAGAAA